MQGEQLKIIFDEQGNGHAKIYLGNISIGSTFYINQDIALRWGDIIHRLGNPNPPNLIAQYLVRSYHFFSSKAHLSETDNPFETQENGTDTNPSDAESPHSEQ